MFAMTDLDGTGIGVLWFHCGAERYHELLEIDGIRPAPHLARAFWVALERWDALRPREIEQELARAHALIYNKLPKRTRAALALPEKERAQLIRERKKLLAAGADCVAAFSAGVAAAVALARGWNRGWRRAGADRRALQPSGAHRACDLRLPAQLLENSWKHLLRR